MGERSSTPSSTASASIVDSVAVALILLASDSALPSFALRPVRHSRISSPVTADRGRYSSAGRMYARSCVSLFSTVAFDRAPASTSPWRRLIHRSAYCPTRSRAVAASTFVPLRACSRRSAKSSSARAAVAQKGVRIR